MSRYADAPVYRPTVPGETVQQANERRYANKRDRDAWHAYGDMRCARCGMVRHHVSHEMDPENSPEGAAYHADFAHHPFEEPA